jgi:hypothetical protein
MTVPNVAVTDLELLSVTAQLPVPVHEPLQPENPLPLAARVIAVSLL